MSVDWQTVVTAAAVGSIASTIITLVGQAFERRSRQRELVLARSLDLAKQKREMLMMIVENSGGRVRATLRDDIFAAEEYYEALMHLLHKGVLSPTAKAKLEKSVAELEARKRTQGEE